MLRLALAAIVLFSAAANAADVPSGVPITLFNGKNLDGWIVTDCKAGVEDGLLVLQEGNGLVRSAHHYGDFVLDLDFKPRKDQEWDSGIYIRADLPAEGKQWPSRYQVNLKQGMEGNVNTLAGATSTGLVKPGQWNHFTITVAGDTAELAINGTPAWKASGLEPKVGYIGFQAEVPLGGQFEFANITIRELDHRLIFNGKDIDNWKTSQKDEEPNWVVEPPLLKCVGRKGGAWLRSRNEYDDFNLRLDYKLEAGGNSGVYLRIAEDGKHRDPGDGVEIQILDDAAPQYANLKPYQYCGSVYAIVAAEPHVCRPAGQWNSLEINCRGSRYTIVHNGVTIVDADASQYPELDQRRMAGFLGLQNHSEPVWFRDIRIGKAYE